ncbi:MAG: hypothetical protein HPZ91_13525 [Lentisphaeria bacterium]|nr:hypothetical protein [Lentisphaeria bacterium]
MSTAKKICIALLLLIGVVFVINAFTTDKPAEKFRLRPIPEEEFASAGRFIGRMTEFARKGAANEFARHCRDAKDKTTLLSWRNMRKFGTVESRLVRISSYEADPERCRLHLENARGEIGTAVCRRESGGEWKFLSFTYVDPEDAQ